MSYGCSCYKLLQNATKLLAGSFLIETHTNCQFPQIRTIHLYSTMNLYHMVKNKIHMFALFHVVIIKTFCLKHTVLYMLLCLCASVCSLCLRYTCICTCSCSCMCVHPRSSRTAQRMSRGRGGSGERESAWTVMRQDSFPAVGHAAASGWI